MAKPSGPMQEVARLLDLVPYLSTHSYISMKELASEFDITERELANELTALSMCGLPGYTPYELIDIFFESGFVSITNHDPLDIPRALSQLEVASLLLGLELLRESLNDESSSVKDEIDTLVEQLRTLAGNAITAQAPADLGHLSTIQKAVAHRTCLSVTYLSTQKDLVGERIIEPLDVYHDGDVSYLSAFCRSVQGYRNFRLDRIQNLSEVNEPRTALKTEAGSESEKIPVGVKFHNRRRESAELLSLSQISAQGEATVEVFNEEWLVRAVLSSSPAIEVKAPKALRSQIQADAEKILALYRS